VIGGRSNPRVENRDYFGKLNTSRELRVESKERGRSKQTATKMRVESGYATYTKSFIVQAWIFMITMPYAITCTTGSEQVSGGIFPARCGLPVLLQTQLRKL
jgi:hypothetical protein